MATQANVDAWNKIADDAQSAHDWDVKIGRLPPSPCHAANTYLAAAMAFQKEVETGVAHCACCLKPR